MEAFKWWPQLHGLWRTLLNFNPYTVTSDHGQDLAKDAHSVLMGDPGDGDVSLGMVCVRFSFVDVSNLAVCSGRR